MNKRKTNQRLLFAGTATLLIGIGIWLLQNNQDETNDRTEQNPSASEIKASADVPPKSLGAQVSQMEPTTFVLPFFGPVKCRMRTEDVEVPVTDGEIARMKLKVFYGDDNEIIRLEYDAKPGWKRKRPQVELESILASRGEKFYGVGKSPQPRTWKGVFEAMSDHVDFRKAKHFDITYVDWGVVSRNSIYICNVYGARGYFGESDDEDENNVRIRLLPKEGRLRFDELL